MVSLKQIHNFLVLAGTLHTATPGKSSQSAAGMGSDIYGTLFGYH